MKHINYALVVLVPFIARLVIFGASIGDSIVALSLASLYGYTCYLANSKEEPINDVLKQDIENIKSKVNSITIAKTYTQSR